MSLANNLTFLQALKSVENNQALAKKRGTYKDVQGEWRWFPDKSPEGGTPTLAYGHKLTEQEWVNKRISFNDPTTGELTSKDFRYGVTDEQAVSVLKQDIQGAEAKAERDWNHYQGINRATGVLSESKAYVNLRDAYKMILVDKAFNSYLVKDGKWIWTQLAKSMLAGDDTGVVKNSVAKWKDKQGNTHALTSRAIEICKAGGLPWQVLSRDS